MKRWVAVVTVLALFVVGVAVGVLGTHIFYSREIDRFGGGGAFGAHRFVERLERDLGLTADQSRRIDEILERSRTEADALHREIFPRVEGQMRQTRERIREVLTPEQQTRFDEFHQRHRRRAERLFMGRGGRGLHGPPPHGKPRTPPPETAQDD